jgi:hypothetical protein
MTQIGSVGGEIWQIGGEKWGSRHVQLDVCPGPGWFQVPLLQLDLWMPSLETARFWAHVRFTF